MTLPVIEIPNNLLVGGNPLVELGHQRRNKPSVVYNQAIDAICYRNQARHLNSLAPLQQAGHSFSSLNVPRSTLPPLFFLVDCYNLPDEIVIFTTDYTKSLNNVM